MFFYGGLKTAARICDILNHVELSIKYNEKAVRLCDSINTLLFDQERDLYFEGLNTETPENLIGVFMPQNVNKRYYLAYSNILAAYFGICGSNIRCSWRNDGRNRYGNAAKDCRKALSSRSLPTNLI